jgi:UDP-glucuronate 4-epimerase
VTQGTARYLVTGALGCIGAWTVRALVQDGLPVVALDIGEDRHRLTQIMSEPELASVRFARGDITDLDAVRTILDEHDITNVIHLAALQVPFCKADPPLGARVNVLGTINIFEAVKARRDRAVQMAPIVYTSSIGMFSGEDVDPATGRLTATAPAHPLNHYGVFKQANEGNARVYWLDDGIASIGVRPMTVYGVGRDQGMTSGPTKAIVAAVLGRAYEVPFRGPTLFQYADDVARILLLASRSSAGGASVFNLSGSPADDRGILGAIEAAVPGAGSLISFADVQLPFPADIDSDGLDTLGPIPVTPFDEGVRRSVAIYRALQSDGRLRAGDHGLDP